MDIPRMSMAISQYNVRSQISTGMFKMQLDKMSEFGDDLAKMLSLTDTGQASAAKAAYQTLASLDATVGQILDLSV